MEEIWKPSPSTNNRYLVSNLGRVKICETKVFNNQNKSSERLVKSKILSPKTKSNGYKEVNVSIATQVGKSMYIHRLVAEAFIGDIPIGYTVNHIDGDKSNNKLTNLEIITYSENMTHSYKKLGRKPNINRGEKSSVSKMTEGNILKIKEFLNKGLTQKEVGAIFGLSQSHISRIHRNESWSHLNV